VDPIKANEIPIPRGAASKKRRISEEDSNSASRKMKKEFHNSEMSDGTIRHRNSLPNAFSMAQASELRGLVFSAQQALDQVQPEDSMPIDPSLQSYGYDEDTIMADESPQHTHRDTVMSSIEHVPDGFIDGSEVRPNSARGGPSVEPLTPGPVVDDISHQTNGISQGQILTQANDVIAVAPPMTPTAPRSAGLSSSGQKPSRTPRPAHSNNRTPKSTPGGIGQDGSFKVEPRSEQKLRATSSATADAPEELASVALALKLAMEDHGLRRRSK
jgi:F-box/leucine-rich repeat protein 10/11